MKKLMMLVIAGMFSAGAAMANEGDKVDFDKLDQDGDGQLSRTEVAQNAELAAQFSTVDANGDGYLDQSEVDNAAVTQETAAEDEYEMEDDQTGDDY